MVSILLFDLIAGYALYRAYKNDKAKGAYPENELFDPDLDKLWNIDHINKTLNKINNPIPVRDDELIQHNFELWLERERRRDKTLEDYLWEAGYVNPIEIVWVDGVPLTPGNAKDTALFEQIKDKALLEGQFQQKLLTDGGLEDLYVKWFEMKGCSHYGAQLLLSYGINPWDWDNYI